MMSNIIITANNLLIVNTLVLNFRASFHSHERGKVVYCRVLYYHLFIDPRTTGVLMKIHIGRDRLQANIGDYFSHTRTALHCYPDDSFTQLRAYQGGYIGLKTTWTGLLLLIVWIRAHQHRSESVSVKQKDFFVSCFRMIHCWPRLLLDRSFLLNKALSIFDIRERKSNSVFDKTRTSIVVTWKLKTEERLRLQYTGQNRKHSMKKQQSWDLLINWEWLIADRTIIWVSCLSDYSSVIS